MVTKGTTTQGAKRKKTEEMSDSPPKRVTRARTAKASDDHVVEEKPTRAEKTPLESNTNKKKKVVKASVSQKTAPATKRKARGDDVEALDDKPAPEIETEEESKPKPAASKGSRKKTSATQEEPKSETVDAPKPRGRPAKAAPAATSKATTATTRGRTTKKGTSEPVIEPQAAESPVRKATRGRAAAATNPTAPKATTRARATKKVQFQEEIDKENFPLEMEASKKTVKSAMKPTGIRAKPVRKQATTRTATRGRRAAKDHAEERQEQLPLSPKKVIQVAKAGSASSEDELAGESTPIRSPSKSPSKLLTSPLRIINMTTMPNSPSKSSPAASSLSSPARRPPPSPFKDGLRMSPKKVDIIFSNQKSLSQATLNKTPAKSSLLQESPRKMIFPNNVGHTTLTASQSPVKASLLQSPARRPMTSPFKGRKTLDDKNTSKPVSPMKLPSPPKPMRFSPQQAASSPLRAARCPERAMQVHKITPKGQGAQPVFDMPSPSMSDSPEKPVSSDVAISEATVDADTDTNMHDVEHTAPNEPREVASETAFSTSYVANDPLRRISLESGSTDELSSPGKMYAPTPLRRNATCQDFATPTTAARAAIMEASNDVSFTPLVGKVSSWSASSPGKQNEVKLSRHTRGVFSLGGATAAALKEESPLKEASPVKTSFFEDELAVMDEELKEADEEVDRTLEVIADSENAQIAMQSSMESQASEEYGDENAAPTEAEMLREEQDNDMTKTCTPAKVFTSTKMTPAKAFTQHPTEFHTVSKVPLRASVEGSPLQVTRQRSKSMGGYLSARPVPSVSTQSAAVESLPDQPETPQLVATVLPQTPSSSMKLDAETPGCTVWKGVVPDVLKGAIVHVDVHTTEGADASSIFVDLLTQMGARCVKQWNWNPRASMGSSLDNSAPLADASPSTSPSTSRVGITHVVYKDGGQRTLQKVRQSNGVVSCVGVGWVLE